MAGPAKREKFRRPAASSSAAWREVSVIERAIVTAALMLGSDRSRGCVLEMICADFLTGANLNNGDPETLLFSLTRLFKFLPGRQRQAAQANQRRHESDSTKGATLRPAAGS
jgi:hypothetical protein